MAAATAGLTSVWTPGRLLLHMAICNGSADRWSRKAPEQRKVGARTIMSSFANGPSGAGVGGLEVRSRLRPLAGSTHLANLICIRRASSVPARFRHPPNKGHVSSWRAILCNVPLLWDTAALRMACRQPRSISGLVEEILKWARQDLKRAWLAKSSGSTCRSSCGASHLVATSMAGILEFVKAAAAVTC
jgi:hypothetical protein